MPSKPTTPSEEQAFDTDARAQARAEIWEIVLKNRTQKSEQALEERRKRERARAKLRRIEQKAAALAKRVKAE